MQSVIHDYLLTLYYSLCKIEECEDLDDNIEDIIKEFEEKNKRTLYHHVAFY